MRQQVSDLAVSLRWQRVDSLLEDRRVGIHRLFQKTACAGFSFLLRLS